MKRFLPAFALFVFFPKLAAAHCPLCTVGAGVLAVLAASLGVSSMVVGVLIGAFALALSLWIAKMPKKEYVPYQKQLLTLVIFLGTAIPIMPLIVDYAPLYVSLWGTYGNPLHTTYTVNLFLVGVLIGALLLFVAPYESRWLTRLRGGKQFPYQGITITLLSLIIVSALIQIFS